jgi:hypothetical protein
MATSTSSSTDISGKKRKIEQEEVKDNDKKASQDDSSRFYQITTEDATQYLG